MKKEFTPAKWGRDLLDVLTMQTEREEALQAVGLEYRAERDALAKELATAEARIESLRANDGHCRTSIKKLVATVHRQKGQIDRRDSEIESLQKINKKNDKGKEKALQKVGKW